MHHAQSRPSCCCPSLLLPSAKYSIRVRVEPRAIPNVKFAFQNGTGVHCCCALYNTIPPVVVRHRTQPNAIIRILVTTPMNIYQVYIIFYTTSRIFSLVLGIYVLVMTAKLIFIYSTLAFACRSLELWRVLTNQPPSSYPTHPLALFYGTGRQTIKGEATCI